MSRVPRWLVGLLRLRYGAAAEDLAGDLDELAPARVAEVWRTLWIVYRGVALLMTWRSTGEGEERWPRGTAHEVRVALRTMRRTPAVTGTVVVTLALAIGATAAIFSVVDAVLLRSLPFDDPERLVVVYALDPTTGERGPVSPLDLEDFRSGVEAFEELAGWTPERYALTGEGTPRDVLVMRFAAGLFDVLGVSPALGRLPDPSSEADRGTVMLTHGFWTSAFGAEPAVVGRTITLDGASYEVGGVLPSEFRFPDDDRVAVWMPLVKHSWELRRWTRHTSALGRLAPGVGLERARSELSALASRLSEEFPETNEGWGVEVVPARVLKGENRAVALVFAAVGVVLLIACINVANLFLVRATERRQEWSVRRALGAGRGRLARQMLVESGLHATLGAVGGLALGAVALRVILAMEPGGLPRWNPIRLDGRVVLFTAGLTVLVALMAGVIPALRAGSVPDGAAVGRGPADTGDRGSGRGRALLSALQVALAVVLSVGAALLTVSLLHLRAQDPGFRTAGVLAFTVELSSDRYGYDDGTMAGGYARIREEVLDLPGVLDAGWVTALPMDPAGTDYDIEFYRVERPDLTPVGTPPTADFRVVSPGYLEALDIGVLAGRGPSEADRIDTEAVVLINQTLADRYFPGEDPVGQGLRIFEAAGGVYRIVGVVGGVRHRGLHDVSRPEIYAPLTQMTHDGMTLVVHADGDPSALVPAAREAVARVDPNLPLLDVATMEQRVAATLAQRRFGTALLGSFAGLGLLLALLGVHGTLAYAVSCRRREIGVRMAMGAGRGAVVRRVVTRGGGIVLAGLVAGLVGAVVLADSLRSILFGVVPTDPATLAAVTGIVATVGLAACLVPALRASAVNPVEALRED